MTTQEHDSNGIVQYLPYPHGPIPPLHHSPLLARVTWTCPSASRTSQSIDTPTQHNATFHYFPKLPLELRIKIWHYAPRPRVIEIRSWGDTERNPLTPIKYSIPPQKPPAIFRVNHESRSEALRFYSLVEIGVSSSTLDPNKEYLDWKHHPSNPHRPFRSYIYETPSFRQAQAQPYPAQKTYADFSRDTIYLGPEFRSLHLETFLKATGPKMELSGLQYLAIDSKLWLDGSDGRLQSALYALVSRPLKEIYIVPDDVKGSLDDRFYYREHEIWLQDPPYTYTFRLPQAKEQSRTVSENLQEWFERLWDGKEAPRVEVRSVRRDGRCLTSFRDGIWEVQKTMADMRDWKGWSPPTTL